MKQGCTATHEGLSDSIQLKLQEGFLWLQPGACELPEPKAMDYLRLGDIGNPCHQVGVGMSNRGVVFLSSQVGSLCVWVYLQVHLTYLQQFLFLTITSRESVVLPPPEMYQIA